MATYITVSGGQGSGSALLARNRADQAANRLRRTEDERDAATEEDATEAKAAQDAEGNPENRPSDGTTPPIVEGARRPGAAFNRRNPVRGKPGANRKKKLDVLFFVPDEKPSSVLFPSGLKTVTKGNRPLSFFSTIKRLDGQPQVFDAGGELDGNGVRPIVQYTMLDSQGNTRYYWNLRYHLRICDQKTEAYVEQGGDLVWTESAGFQPASSSKWSASRLTSWTVEAVFTLGDSLNGEGISFADIDVAFFHQQAFLSETENFGKYYLIASAGNAQQAEYMMPLGFGYEVSLKAVSRKSGEGYVREVFINNQLFVSGSATEPPPAGQTLVATYFNGVTSYTGSLFNVRGKLKRFRVRAQ